MASLKMIIAKEIIIFSITLISSGLLYVSIRGYNYFNEEKINELRHDLSKPDRLITNLNSLSNTFIQKGWFLDKSDFLNIILDTSQQRDFYNGLKENYFKNLKDFSHFKKEYFLDSIHTAEQFEKLELQNQLRIRSLQNQINQIQNNIISDKQTRLYILILLIVFYPARLLLIASIWALKTLKQNS